MPLVSCGDIEINYQDAGLGEVVLLVHGLGSSSEDWRQQIDFFSPNYRVISVDCRGHGLSGKPDQRYSIELYCQDILSLLDHLDIESFHVVGLSMGGMIAFQLGVDKAPRVKTMTIINSAPAVPYDNYAMKFAVFVRLACIRLFGMEKLAMIVGKKLFPRPDQSDLVNAFCLGYAKIPPSIYIRALKSFLGWSVVDKIENLTMPCLIVAGDQDYTPVSSKQAYVNLMPNAELVVIENSRHATPIDQPEKLNAVIEQFLSKSEHVH